RGHVGAGRVRRRRHRGDRCGGGPAQEAALMTAARGVDGQPGFTKPPMLGVRISVWRTVAIALVSAAWIVAAWGRLHPAAVAVPPVVVVLIAFTTIYHVSLTRWVLRWWSW